MKILKKIIPFIILAIVATIIFLFANHIICIHKWQEADCISAKKCSICGDTEGEPLSHDYSELTCIDDSVCIRCGETGEKAKGHIWSEITCTEDAICKECGETGEKAKGHIWIDATCTSPKTCSVCNETTGEKSEHTWIEATCTESGKCSICGEVNEEALGHEWIAATYENPKTCTRCGETEGEKLQTYNVSFSIDEIINTSGVAINDWDIYSVSNISCNNGNASLDTTSVGVSFHIDQLNSVYVSKAVSGNVTISGTINSYNLILREDAPGSYQIIDSVPFTLTKRVG